MPVQSRLAFASHIGHTGKTTLCFQLSCYYARNHPEESVLVMDMAEEGDATKRFLGGVDSSKANEDLFGGIFKLLGDADRKSSGLTRWLWQENVDITAHAVRVADRNPHVPPNVYLVSSGAWPRADKPWTLEERRRLCAKILQSLETSKKSWSLFCDTDGDRRPSPSTMLAYGLCPHIIVPLHLNKGDLDRTETMLGTLAELRAQGEVGTQVLMVVWNMVKSMKEEPLEHHGAWLPFTPTKVSLDILDACNKRLVQMARDPDLPGLFVRGGADVGQEEFLGSSTAVFRQLADNVVKPAEELGMPFAEMIRQLERSGKKQMKFQSGPEGVVYEAKGEVIRNVDESMQGLCESFEQMAIQR